MHSPYRKGRKQGKGERRSLLNAAAFQDHMARLISLPSGGAGPVSTSGVVQVRRTASSRGGADEGKGRDEGEVVGRGHRLTLAQKYGLVSAPRSKLDEYEWMQAHAQSVQREDVKHGCPICYEDFKGEDRVLLSCSHMFHKHCLRSFERFTKQKCCPICRTLQYQKRVVTNAKELYEEDCATCIQKYYRRRLAQKRYKVALAMRVPNDEKERQEWCATRFSETNNKLIERLEEEDDSIERLLADLDRKIFFSRTAREIADTSLREPRDDRGAEDSSAASNGKGAGHPKEEKREIDWEGLKSKARKRKDKTCPICIGPLARKLRGDIALLSCSHCFHEDCIHLFELFQQAEDSKPICPLCRCEYEKKVIPNTEL
ncbi:Ring zinc finger protein [Chloropicon primus]|uniref:Ring zinc finger protein n=1 Tax=Chloropicon primus TaxID=1764295 RepID=A0A5B8MEC2_9CHLO|nr:Ring zinc finger protein [Chloropicon primus]UPQ97220.1 Ring zinc finger protein [Chloropicon primus]|eukprot:QDZ18005.1 Ring zinc finger protein [Chloropicon primus]